MEKTFPTLTRRGWVVNRRGSLSLQTLDFVRADDQLGLPEAGLERAPVLRPPLTVERRHHDLEDDDVIPTSVARARQPQTRRDRAYAVRPPNRAVNSLATSS